MLQNFNLWYMFIFRQVFWFRHFHGSFQVWLNRFFVIKGSLDEKLPIYEQDPKSKRLDSFEKRFVRD